MIIRSSFNTARMLVAANSVSLGHGIRDALAHAEFELDCAPTVQQALELAQQSLQAAAQPYAVAFVDSAATAQRLWALDPGIQIVLCAAAPESAKPGADDTLGTRDGRWLIARTPLVPAEVVQTARTLAEKWQLHRLAERPSPLADSAAEALKQTKAELASEHDLLSTLMENSPDSIFFKDLASRFVRLSRAEVNNLRRLATSHYLAAHPHLDETQLPPHLASVAAFEQYVIGKTDADIYGPERAKEFSHDEEEIIRTGQPLGEKSERTVHPDGRVVWYLTTKGPWRDRHGKLIGTFGTSKNISELKEAERKIEEVQAQLVTAARLAGMAEIATNVLHNVGNVLNSVNVSADLIGAQLRNSKLKGLTRAAALLQAHAGDLGEFLTQDSKGRLLPGYLRDLAPALEAEHQAITSELAALSDCVDHIKQVIATQQSYAGTACVMELVKVDELLDDALRMNANALMRHKVDVAKHCAPLPALLLDRHRVLQVLVNLISNAKQALGSVSDRRALITLQTELIDGPALRITVTDNGEGIPAENLTRVFSHGFTTRKDGHGFGLHSCVLAAQEMGGSLQARSDGPGHGASFVLEVPVVREPGS